MYSKDIERLARSLHAQRLEREYIQHYLMEAYQLEAKAVEEILDRVGVPKKLGRNGKPAPAAGDKPEKGPPRQAFY